MFGFRLEVPSAGSNCVMVLSRQVVRRALIRQADSRDEWLDYPTFTYARVHS